VVALGPALAPKNSIRCEEHAHPIRIRHIQAIERCANCSGEILGHSPTLSPTGVPHIMLHSTLPFGTRLFAVSILSLLLIIPKAVSFQLSSLPSITTAATAPSAAHGRHPSLLSASSENIEVEDFEEYARCLSPREVSCWLIALIALSP
jgi:hypothetical protein